MKTDEKKILSKETKEQPKDKDRKYSKTYEAALKLKGSIKVNDLTLFFSVLDRHIGPRGGEARDDFEREVIEAVESSKMAESLTGSRNYTIGCNNGGSAASTIKG